MGRWPSNISSDIPRSYDHDEQGSETMLSGCCVFKGRLTSYTRKAVCSMESFSSYDIHMELLNQVPTVVVTNAANMWRSRVITRKLSHGDYSLRPCLSCGYS